MCGALAHDTSSVASTYLGSMFVIGLTSRYGFEIKKLCIPTFRVSNHTRKKWVTGGYGQWQKKYRWVGMGPKIATHTRKLGSVSGNGHSGMIRCGTLITKSKE